MSFFVESTPAAVPKTKNVRFIGIGLAAIFVGMAVAQLFTFETFASVISGMNLPGGNNVSSTRAAVIVVLEVTAVPFLLGMRLSFAMRLVSMIAGWLVTAAWLFTSFWVNVSNESAPSGLLGDTIALPVGWWSVFICLGLVMLAAWSAWGMWPIAHTKHKQ